MSDKEIGRLEVLEKILAKRLTQKSGAKQLGLSRRQMIRVVKKYQTEGATSLISKRRGKASNRRYSDDFKAQVLDIVRANYADFGPTLASEKLQEREQLSLSKETLREWMIEAGVWRGKHRKSVAVHQQRARRACVGELVQIDGSPHAWFEERGPYCCLLVYIDDATSQLLQLHFCKAETTDAYFNITRNYIKQHGRPAAFYSDKHSIFRINVPEATASTGETQFGRALRELGIELICAHSPQAKGRVEKANATLQDRLVKELRLKQINSIEAANAFVPTFIQQFNQKFAKAPASPVDMHRSALPTDETLDLIFSHQSTRKLSKNLELSYNNIIYQIQTSAKGHRLRQANITVCENTQKQVTLLHKNTPLKYIAFDKNNRPAPILSSKEIEQALMPARAAKQVQKPKANHPWRQYEKTQNKQKMVA